MGDPSQKIVIMETEGQFHVKHEGPNGSWGLTFRLDEEFEFEMPFRNEKFRAIKSVHGGDTLVAVFRGPRFTIRTTTKYTDNFAIQV